MGLTIDLKRTTALIWTHKSALQEAHQRDSKHGLDVSEHFAVRGSSVGCAHVCVSVSVCGCHKEEKLKCETGKKKNDRKGTLLKIDQRETQIIN